MPYLMSYLICRIIRKLISQLGKRFEELKRSSSLSNTELQEFTDIQNQLKELLPEVNGHYDAQGNFIINEEENLAKLNETYKEYIQLKRTELAEASKKSIGFSIKEYENEKKQLEDLIQANKLYKASKERALTYDEEFQLESIQNTYNVPIGKIDKAIRDVSDSIKKRSEEINGSIRDIVFETEEWGKLTEKEKRQHTTSFF